MSKASAMASITNAASAPWRNSPSRSRDRNDCSSTVAAANSAAIACARRALLPPPEMAAMSVSLPRVSATVSRDEGQAGVVVAACTWAGPTPSRSRPVSPVSHKATVPTSSAVQVRSKSASRDTLAPRARSWASAREVSATEASCSIGRCDQWYCSVV